MRVINIVNLVLLACVQSCTSSKNAMNYDVCDSPNARLIYVVEREDSFWENEPSLFVEFTCDSIIYYTCHVTKKSSEEFRFNGKHCFFSDSLILGLISENNYRNQLNRKAYSKMDSSRYIQDYELFFRNPSRLLRHSITGKRDTIRFINNKYNQNLDSAFSVLYSFHALSIVLDSSFQCEGLGSVYIFRTLKWFYSFEDGPNQYREEVGRHRMYISGSGILLAYQYGF